MGSVNDILYLGKGKGGPCHHGMARHWGDQDVDGRIILR